MTDPILSGWPDASQPGVPWKPIRAIYHYWMGDEFASEPTPFRWQPGLQSWRTGPAQDDNMTSEQMEAQGWRYLGPCLLAYEVNALVAKEREACAATAEREACAEGKEGPLWKAISDAAAEIRRLEFEIERLRAERDEAVATLALYRAENGCTRGQMTTQWCGEASRLRRAWLRLIQRENHCPATGGGCFAEPCSCLGEMEKLVEENCA